MNAPRMLMCGDDQLRLIIFTDASLERADSVAGVGMAALLLQGQVVKRRFFFSDVVPPHILETWQNRTKKIVRAVESFAAVCAVEVMTKDLSAIRTFPFIDNEAARAALIAMYSPITLHAQMLKDLNSIVMSRSLYMWTARVPSAANPADGPSRNMVPQNMKQSGAELKIPWSLKETYKG